MEEHERKEAGLAERHGPLLVDRADWGAGQIASTALPQPYANEI